MYYSKLIRKPRNANVDYNADLQERWVTQIMIQNHAKDAKTNGIKLSKAKITAFPQAEQARKEDLIIYTYVFLW